VHIGNSNCSDARHDAGPGPQELIPSLPYACLPMQAFFKVTPLRERIWRYRQKSRAYLSGVPASCATTCRPKSKGCLSSLVMGCTSREPSGRMARKYSLSPTTSCSWLREALPTAFDRAVKAKPCACAACWNACKSQASVWSVLQQHGQTALPATHRTVTGLCSY